MTGHEASRERPQVAPVPAARQGMVFDQLTGDERIAALRAVLDYRGDVTLRLDDGSRVAGYVFSLDERAREPHVKLLSAEGGAQATRVEIARIAGLEVSGRDTADGRSWEAWVRRHEEKKRLAAQGIDVGDIEPQPESLD